MKNLIKSAMGSGFKFAATPSRLPALAALCLTMGIAQEAAASTLAYEGFQYVVNQPLPTMAGGFGWASGPWTQLSGGMVDQPPSLFYPAALPPNGDALLTLGTGGAARSFAAPYNNAASDLWISFEEKTSVGAVSGALVDIQQPLAVLPDIAVNKDAGGAITLNGVAAGFSAGVGAVDFFVLQMVQFAGGNNIVNLYVDPGAILGPPSASVAVAGPAFQAAQFIYQGNAGQLLDEIRVGTTVSDVSAVPEPSTLKMAAGALLLVFTAARRSRGSGR